MVSLHISGVAFSHADPVDIFCDLDLDLHAGWTGLVGPNGSGKSTLLGLLAGELAPARGTIDIRPPGALVHLCPQRVDAVDDAIHELAGAWTRRAIRICDQLALSLEELERWPTLSPGERKRWQIGAALFRAPEVLLLDEPSNHVDHRTRDLLLDALGRFRGLGVLVSHDRELLETLTQNTVRLVDTRAELQRGAYAAASDVWRARADAERERHASARRQEKSLRQRLARERDQRVQAEARISTRARAKGPGDSDARSSLAKGRVMNAESRLSRKVSILGRAVERAEHEVAAYRVRKERGRSLFLDHQPAPKSWLGALDLEHLRAGQRVLAEHIHVALARDARVRIHGVNGAGKTTLLKALLATMEPARVLYLPQELDGSELAPGEALERMSPETRSRTLHIAAALGLDPARALVSARPSPGEARKLHLARGMAAGVWAIFLDEPTNHLDLPSIERLQSALEDFPGALVLVSHDRVFAEALTDTVWHLDSGALRIKS